MDELNTVVAILALLASLNLPSWALAIMLWVYILRTEN